jgi:poly-gamma-glutamate synthesis protein (capsule biosynthesis protein)
MFLTGDINLANVTDPTKPFELVADTLHGEDIVFGNLEGCLSDVIDPYHYMSKSGWRNAGAAGAPSLRLGGFDAVGCANNVTIGREAILESLAVLDELGITHTGAGADLTSARTPVILERGGTRFGFLQYTSVFWPFGHQAGDKRDSAKSGIYTKRWDARAGVPDAPLPIEAAVGVATIKANTAYLPNSRTGEMPGGPATTLTWPDPEYLKAFREDVRELREKVDVLVTSHHWGISGSDDTQQYQVDIAHAAIDAGADLVMGHGPHVIQPIEVYQGRAIFYSLGNFHFGWEGMGPDWVGLVVQAEVRDKSIASVSCSPVVEDNHTNRRSLIRTVEQERGAMENLLRLSDRFGTELALDGDCVQVV